MMNISRKILLGIFLFAIAIATKPADGQKIDSKLQKVIVFLNGAQVNRTATVNIAAGTSTLIFTGISPNIDVQSLQVRAAGDFTILSVKNELNFLNEQVRQKGVEELREQQKALEGKISYQNTLMAIVNTEEEMLTKNQVITGQNTSLDVVKLKQALDFQTARLTAIKQKQAAINEQVKQLNIQIEKYNRQIADALKGSTKATSDILVTISSKAAVQSVFTLSYVVNNASWYPTYDIRAKNVNSPVTIAYKANVNQQSGEDWKNVKLTLSSGNPSINGSKPFLQPYYLNFGNYYQRQNAITKVSGRVTDNGVALPAVSVNVKGTSIGTATDPSGNYSIQIPGGGNQTLAYSYIGYERAERAANNPVINVDLKPMAAALNEVVVVGYGSRSDKQSVSRKEAISTRSIVSIRGLATTNALVVQQTENQTNIEFNIENPYSIPSDGKQYLVEINEIEVPATYQYYTAPKISTDVFLTAIITDWNKYNFLSGEANLFFEGTFLGKSLIDTQNATDTLNVSLGTDKNIVVSRNLQKELTSKQIFGSNKRDTRDWLINIKNRKNQPINLLIEDQVPIAQNSTIEVEVQDVTAGLVDKLTGKVSWKLALNPQDEKKLQLKYQVKYPKDQPLIVQ